MSRREPKTANQSSKSISEHYQMKDPLDHYKTRGSRFEDKIKNRKTAVSSQTFDKTPHSKNKKFDMKQAISSALELSQIDDDQLAEHFQAKRLDTEEFIDEFYMVEQEDSVYDMDKEWSESDHSLFTEEEMMYQVEVVDVDSKDGEEFGQTEVGEGKAGEKVVVDQEGRWMTQRGCKAGNEVEKQNRNLSFLDLFDPSEIGKASCEGRGNKTISLRMFTTKDHASKFRQ